MDEDFVLIDGRWTEQGWLEVFRLRLAGWLPYELVVVGVDKGVLEWDAENRASDVNLSTRGATLTDEQSPSRTDENIQAIAGILISLDFSNSWLMPSDQSAAIYISEKSKFDVEYRKSVLEALEKRGFLHG